MKDQRAFRPLHSVAGPLRGPSSNHPLCGWYMILKNSIRAKILFWSKICGNMMYTSAESIEYLQAHAMLVFADELDSHLL
jgi:hypothetical protein